MTPKADELRARVAALADLCNADEIAAATGIRVDRVEEILDELHEVEHDSWFYRPAPVLEPDKPKPSRLGPNGRWA